MRTNRVHGVRPVPPRKVNDPRRSSPVAPERGRGPEPRPLLHRRGLVSGLAAVAIALGQGNLALAQITAVHLRLPDLRDTVARAALEAEDLSIKRGSAAWDEARHPRTGTPPNPGWFAPNAGAEARSRPTQTAQGGRGGRRPEATSDPMGEVRQAVWTPASRCYAGSTPKTRT